MSKVLILETDDTGATATVGAISQLVTELVGDSFEDIVVTDNGTVVYVSEDVEVREVN